MTEKEKIDTISAIVRNQFDDVQEMLNEVLNDSSISTDYYGEVRGIVRYFMAIAVQQREEREAIFKQLTRDTEVSCTAPRASTVGDSKEQK